MTLDEAFDEVIEKLEQELKPRWIPVSERLPETNEEAYSDDVLLSLKETDWDVDKYQMVHITTIGNYNEAALSSDGRYMDTEGWVIKSGTRLPFSDVIAWMPLPEPYKAESEE